MFRRVMGSAALLVVVGFVAMPNLTIQPESKVWVDGNSTVRGFTCTAASVAGSVVAAPGAQISLDRLADVVTDVELVVPVAKLGCGNNTMNEHMVKALKGDAHKTITWRQQSYSVLNTTAGKTTLELVGTFTIGGVERPVKVQAVATEQTGGLRVQGSHTLRMTEFGLKPPTLMLGTMKVHDNVTVNFDMLLKQ